MKIWIRFELTDEQRKAIAMCLDEDGMANYLHCKSWIESTVLLMLESAVSEYSGVPIPDAPI